MAKNNAVRFRDFRKWAYSDALSLLSELRVQSAEEGFSRLIARFLRDCPQHASRLLAGRSSFGDLYFDLALSALDLGGELKWAAKWLTRAAPRINAFVDDVFAIQQELLQCGANAALDLLARRSKKRGCTAWGMEILYGLTALSGGDEAVSGLREQTRGSDRRMSSLLTLIFADRNDSSVEYSDFLGRCRNSFPRLIDRELRVVAADLSSGQLESDEDLALFLAKSFSCSLYDYYEAFLDALIQIMTRPESSEWAGTCASVARECFAGGIRDPRLERIGLIFDLRSRGVSWRETLGNEENSAIDARMAMAARIEDSSIFSSPFSVDVRARMSDVRGRGFTDVAGWQQVLKMALNLKTLPIGYYLSGQVAVALSRIESVKMLSDASVFTASLQSADQLLMGGEDANVRAALSRSLKFKDVVQQGIFDRICEAFGNGGVSSGSVTDEIIWAAATLVNLDRPGRALELLSSSKSLDDYESRRVAKLKMLAYVKAGNVHAALSEAALWLVKDHLFANEFPLTDLFKGRKWASFSGYASALVGLVSHYANSIDPSPDARFICRMACRAFYAAESSRGLDEIWNAANEADRQVLKAFLRDAWSDENLSLVDKFKTSREVRRERIRIFQKLVEWDPIHEAEYFESIRNLTFDETLSDGLNHIDETRIFANESAIARWAEKDLLASFDRWRIAKTDDASDVVTGELLRTYFADPSIDGLIKMLGSELSHADTLLLNMLAKLSQRFFSDPTEGIDCYLSLRIRHGTLRGTVLGPLEQEALLISGDASAEAFKRRWGEQIPEHLYVELESALRDFTGRISALVQALVGDRIQIIGENHPRGMISSAMSEDVVRIVVADFRVPISFSSFLARSFTIFWFVLRPMLTNINSYISNDFKQSVSGEFLSLVEYVEKLGLSSFASVVRSVATSTQLQIEKVGGWFEVHTNGASRSYEFVEAIEIAKRATIAVYRAFFPHIEINSVGVEGLALSANGLVVICDCLYVLLENVWKRSGLQPDPGVIRVDANFDSSTRLLTVSLTNHLSSTVRNELTDDVIAGLRDKYLGDLPVELVPKEGGSGFAKLASMVRSVDRAVCSDPLLFGIRDEKWFVTVNIPLYERSGAYDAFI